jgi:hypothetical protein
MIDRRVFRAEAVAAHARGRGGGPANVPLGRSWLRWLYWAMIGALAVGSIAALLIRTGETAAGPAVVPPHGRTFAALLPVGVAEDLASARSIVLELPGATPSHVTVGRARLRQATPGALKAAGLKAAATPSILLIGTISRDDAARLGIRSRGARGRLIVVLRRESLAQLVARQVGGMVGQGSDR